MIEIVKVKDKAAGQVKAHEILKKIVDAHTLLVLSGGTSIDYKKIIVEPNDFIPGGICIADERWGGQFHENSNEKLISDAGVKDYADEHCIETAKFLLDKNIEETTKIYEFRLKQLFSLFNRRVGIMGVGTNLHTAGIFPKSEAVKSEKLVVALEVDDTFKTRLTLTFSALEKFTGFIVMMFGQEKKDALRILLDDKENDLEKYPAIFYRQSKIKTFVITDINI